MDDKNTHYFCILASISERKKCLDLSYGRGDGNNFFRVFFQKKKRKKLFKKTKKKKGNFWVKLLKNLHFYVFFISLPDSVKCCIT